MKYKFGDVIENGNASYLNPQKIGVFVKYTGKYGKDCYMTDLKGNFWTCGEDKENIDKLVGNILINEACDILKIKNTCIKCKWLDDPDFNSVCVNGESVNCADFVVHDDSCEQFEENHNGFIVKRN